MDWVFEHLQLIIVIGGAIAYWLNQRRREKNGQPADYDGDGIPDNRRMTTQVKPGADTSDEAERTRRIQEEIRRKILERRAGTQTPTRAEPPVLRPAAQPMVKPVEPPLLQSQVRRVPTPAVEDSAMLERQRQLTEKLAALKARRAESNQQQHEAIYGMEPAMAVASKSSAVPNARDGLLDDLRDPAKTRRAIILREILGAPVGFR